MASTQTAIDVGQVKAALTEFARVAAAGDEHAVQRYLYSEIDGDGVMLDVFARLAISASRYRVALEQKFGASAARGKWGTSFPLDPDAIARATIDGVGESATVRYETPAGRGSFVMKMIDGHWRLPPGAVVSRITDAAPHEVGGRYQNMSQSFDEITTAIKAGEYPDAAHAAAAAEQHVTASARGTDAQ